MENITLNIAQVSNKGNKFAIVAGKAILGKFKSIDIAKKQLADNVEYYQYWANSAMSSILNTKPITIIC